MSINRNKSQIERITMDGNRHEFNFIVLIKGTESEGIEDGFADREKQFKPPEL